MTCCASRDVPQTTLSRGSMVCLDVASLPGSGHSSDWVAETWRTGLAFVLLIVILPTVLFFSTSQLSSASCLFLTHPQLVACFVVQPPLPGLTFHLMFSFLQHAGNTCVHYSVRARADSQFVQTCLDAVRAHASDIRSVESVATMHVATVDVNVSQASEAFSASSVTPAHKSSRSPSLTRKHVNADGEFVVSL